jgi:ankyrin repeat protein
MIDFCNDRGQTPLYAAARAGFLEIMEWLVQNGANPDFQNTV